MTWRYVGVPHGPRSSMVLAALLLAGTAWLGWPVWGSLTSPTAADAEAEAPAILAALIAGMLLLAVAMWTDAGRRADALSPVVSLIVVNTLLRTLVNPGAAGVEVVFALPLLAGLALGAPSGFLVGAGSCLLSTLVAGEPASSLPAQALIWGLVGALGGLLLRLRPVTAWLCSLPLAVLAGLLSGVLLNLMGWSRQSGTTTTSFFPGLPATEVLGRLWTYTAETSIVLDLTRGVVTALVLLVAGLPLLRALRPVEWGLLARREATSPGLSGALRESHDVRPEALARREDRARLDRLWGEVESTGRMPTSPHSHRDNPPLDRPDRSDLPGERE